MFFMKVFTLSFISSCVSANEVNQFRQRKSPYNSIQAVNLRASRSRQNVRIRGGSQLTNPSESHALLHATPDTVATKIPQWYMLTIAGVSLADTLVNLSRPDKHACILAEKCPGARVQRALWNIIMAFLGVGCTNPSVDTGLLFLFSIMLYCTAFVDLFWWAPMYGIATEWQTCKCEEWTFFGIFCKKNTCVDDYSKALEKMGVVFQALFTGLFFLRSAIKISRVLQESRDARKINRQVQAQMYYANAVTQAHR